MSDDLRRRITAFAGDEKRDPLIVTADFLAEGIKVALAPADTYFLVLCTPQGDGSNVTFRTNMTPRSKIPGLLDAIKATLEQHDF